MKYALRTTDLYDTWFEAQAPKFQAQVEKRLANITEHGHFGTAKDLGGGLAEIKFNNGARIYFTIERHENQTVVLILGGNKNGQSKDIAKARSLLAR